MARGVYYAKHFATHFAKIMLFALLLLIYNCCGIISKGIVIIIQETLNAERRRRAGDWIEQCIHLKQSIRFNFQASLVLRSFPLWYCTGHSANNLRLQLPPFQLNA